MTARRIPLIARKIGIGPGRLEAPCGWSGSELASRAIHSTGSSCRAVSSHEDDDRAWHHPVAQGGHRGLLPGFRDVEGAIEPRVDRTAPTARRALLNLEVERLLVRAQHDVEVAVAPRRPVQAICKAVRIERQIDVRPDAIPADILAPEAHAAETRMSLAEGDHPLREAKMVGMPFDTRPVEP